MGWVKRKADEHVCKKPGGGPDIRVGDIWECDLCKLRWEVTKASSWYDQRDNYTGYIIDYKLLPPIGVTSWRDQ